MKSPEDIENVLVRLGHAWPGEGSIVERVMRQIESAPPLAVPPKRRKILMKSLLAIAASFLAFLAVWWAIDGSRGSLYAQVMDGVRKAKTVHHTSYVQRKGESQLTKALEAWFAKGVGFRRDVWDLQHGTPRHRTVSLGNASGTWTIASDRPDTIMHSANESIVKETDRIFAEIDQHARWLQDNCRRYPEADQAFNGVSCKAYLFVEKPSAKATAGRNSGELQHLYFVDPQSRLVRIVRQERAGDHWVTVILNTCDYDEPLDAALFQPHFGKDLQVVEAGTEAAKPAVKPEGAVLVYQVDPKSVPVGATVDMDRLLRGIDLRLNGGSERLAAVRKLDDRRIEVTLVRRSDQDRQRVERQLARPGTLEFRVLANRHVDKALIDRAEKEPAKEAVLDPSGKRLAWWVPVKPGTERSLVYPDIAKRTRQVGDRKIMEVLAAANPYNITGAYLTQARLVFTNWGKPTIGFTLNEAGGKLLAKLTGEHLPNNLTDMTYKLGVIIDGELFSAPSIQSTISNRGEITGDFTEVEASDLAALLSAGSLPVRLRLVGEHPHL